MTKVELGDLIKKRRKILKVSQKDLSEYCGLSVMTLSKIEQGKANPTFDILTVIFHYLGLRITITLEQHGT